MTAPQAELARLLEDDGPAAVLDLFGLPDVVDLVWARQRRPDVDVPSVFLAGPTPERGTVPSWRPGAVVELGRHWTRLAQAGRTTGRRLTVFTPESRHGVRATDYDHQFVWETDARAEATCVQFWIPRDMVSMPGMTTNVEFGHDCRTGRAVLGCPPDCPDPQRNRYLLRLARHYGVPTRATLPDTVAASLDLVCSSMAA